MHDQCFAIKKKAERERRLNSKLQKSTRNKTLRTRRHFSKLINVVANDLYADSGTAALKTNAEFVNLGEFNDMMNLHYASGAGEKFQIL